MSATSVTSFFSSLFEPCSYIFVTSSKMLCSAILFFISLTIIAMVRLSLSVLLRLYRVLKNEMVAAPMIKNERILMKIIVLWTCERILTWKKFLNSLLSVPTFKRNEMVCINVTRKRNEQKMYENKVMASMIESTFRAITTTFSPLLLNQSSL